MLYISITRMSVRRLWFLPSFLAATVRLAVQALRAEGFRGGYLRADVRGGFWTVTAWESPRDMRAYTTSGFHSTTALRLVDWADDAMFGGWQAARLPRPQEASRRLLANPTRAELPHQTSRPTRRAAWVAATLPLPPHRRRRPEPGAASAGATHADLVDVP